MPPWLTVASPEAADAAVVLGRHFAALIRRLREDRGWSQERMAERAELNRTYIGEIERAAVMPSLATASKLAQALELPLSALIAQCEQAAPVRRPRQ